MILIDCPSRSAVTAEILRKIGGFCTFCAQSVHWVGIFTLPLPLALYNEASFVRGIVPIGRTAVSKTDGWGFESLCPCQFLG